MEVWPARLEKTAVILRADAGYLPLYWRGLTVRSEGLLVRGKPPRALTELRVENLRASCSLRALWQRKFVISRLQADRMGVAFGAAAGEKLAPILPAQPELQPRFAKPSLGKWIFCGAGKREEAARFARRSSNFTPTARP